VAGLVDENLGPSLDFVCRWIPGRIRLGRDDFYRLRPSISSILAQPGAAIMAHSELHEHEPIVQFDEIVE